MSERRFWRMTLREFHRVVRAYRDRQAERAELARTREEAADFRAAWLVATVMNFAGRQLPDGVRVKPKELLRGGDSPLTEADYADQKARLLERARLVSQAAVSKARANATRTAGSP